MIWIIAYLCTAVAFFAIDFLWLGFVAKRFYSSRLSHLLADRINYTAAAGFYALYIIGVVIFAVAPALEAGSWQPATVHGAMFGFFCYATYDMTNQSTLRNWPAVITIIDISWGTALSGTAATIGYFATLAFT